MLPYHTTPVQEIDEHPACRKAGVRLLVKREDLNHPLVSGNKWWKLKYNLMAALELTHRTVLTFGGAYSNHIYATAAAARGLRLRSIGIIRGEETLPLNPTMKFAADQGMELHYVSRSEYRKKTAEEFVSQLHAHLGEFYLIPEGGSNHLAVKGCAEFAKTELSTIDFDHLLLAVGTGSTVAGMISGLGGKKNILGIPVLKAGGFLTQEVARMTADFSGVIYSGWSLLTGYDAGGYAKATPDLLSFMREMKSRYDLPLDHVYTGKAMMATIKEIESGSFPRGSTILFVHTGGLQGTPPNIIT